MDAVTEEKWILMNVTQNDKTRAKSGVSSISDNYYVLIRINYAMLGLLTVANWPRVTYRTIR